MSGKNIYTFLNKVHTCTSKTISMKTKFAETFSYTVDLMADCILIAANFCKNEIKKIVFSQHTWSMINFSICFNK